MKLGDILLKLIFTISVFLFTSGLVYAVSDDVSQIVFVNEKRNVSPGVLSEVLTIQTQNSSGEKTNISETGDLIFSSSSDTGEFLNDKGAAVSTTMSKNSANRNFYYKDTSAGEHSITVILTGRESGRSWQTSQLISVGEGGANATSTENENNSSGNATTTASTANNSNSTLNNQITFLPSHSSQAQISNIVSEKKIEIGAGRKRMSVVGVPVEFHVENNRNGNFPSNSNFLWSFGDGSIIRGERVWHAYSFPGTYIVNLTANVNGEEAVSRTEVVVHKPNLIFSYSLVDGGYFEIFNNNKDEINLQKFLIKNNDKSFTLPRDTIVMPYTSTKIPLIETEISNPIGSSLIYPNKIIAATILSEPVSNLAVVPNSGSKQIGEKPLEVASGSPSQLPSIKKSEVLKDDTVVGVSSGFNQMASVNQSIVLSKRKNFWDLLVSIFTKDK